MFFFSGFLLKAVNYHGLLVFLSIVEEENDDVITVAGEFLLREKSQT